MTIFSTNVIALGGAPVAGASIAPLTITFPKNDATPLVTQSAQTTDTPTFTLALTSQAPWATATGTNRNSGGITFTVPAPAAGGAYGNISFEVGTGSVLYSNALASGTAFSVAPVWNGATVVSFGAAVTSGTLKIADLTTNSGTGAALTIQAQNETGTTSVGGALNLKSGTGTSTAGAITLTGGLSSYVGKLATTQFAPNGNGTVGTQNMLTAWDVYAVSTTDATPTVLASRAVPSGASTSVLAFLNGRNTSTGATYTGLVIGTVKNVAGTSSLSGTPIALELTGDVAGAVTVTADDTTDTCRVVVTGLAANLDWQSSCIWVEN